jgi:hypothetical protein
MLTHFYFMLDEKRFDVAVKKIMFWRCHPCEVSKISYICTNKIKISMMPEFLHLIVFY